MYNVLYDEITEENIPEQSRYNLTQNKMQKNSMLKAKFAAEIVFKKACNNLAVAQQIMQ